MPGTLQYVHAPQVGNGLPHAVECRRTAHREDGITGTGDEQRRDLDGGAIEVHAAFPVRVVRPIPVEAPGESGSAEYSDVVVEFGLRQPRPRQRRCVRQHVEITVALGRVLPDVEVVIVARERVEQPVQESARVGVELPIRDTGFLKVVDVQKVLARHRRIQLGRSGGETVGRIGHRQEHQPRHPLGVA